MTRNDIGLQTHNAHVTVDGQIRVSLGRHTDSHVKVGDIERVLAQRNFLYSDYPTENGFTINVKEYINDHLTLTPDQAQTLTSKNPTPTTHQNSNINGEMSNRMLYFYEILKSNLQCTPKRRKSHEPAQ